MILLTAAVATGLKNLIAKSSNGHSATIYSIIETAKANRLNPYMYLVHLLTQLPNLGRKHCPNGVAIERLILTILENILPEPF